MNRPAWHGWVYGGQPRPAPKPFVLDPAKRDAYFAEIRAKLSRQVEGDQRAEGSEPTRTAQEGGNAATLVAVVEDSVFRQATDAKKPNIVAGIFFLCTRAPERWKHVNKVEVSGANGQNLTVILRGMAAKRDELAKRWGGEDKGDGLGN